MSLNKRKELTDIAKYVCRELRKNQTHAEKIFWEEVRGRKFCNLKFVRQFPLFHDITGKETFFIADFFCFEKKIIVELDGIIHKYRLRQDEERTKILNKLGLKVVRIDNDEIEKDLKSVMEKLRKHIS
ncbi:MAG TPA: hypothetical protein DHV28_05330 [Ignavibacteriales bacterium]|nr:hypothetical protein [Ignavibacteriales bacterium]